MKQLDILEQAYKRTQNLPDSRGKVFEKFLRCTACPQLFEEGALWEYIHPVVYWYDERFESSEFKKLFGAYFEVAKRIAKRCEENFALTEEQVEELGKKCEHPFHVGCGSLGNGHLWTDLNAVPTLEKQNIITPENQLPTGKELWFQVLRQAQERESYFVLLENKTLDEQMRWHEKCIENVGQILWKALGESCGWPGMLEDKDFEELKERRNALFLLLEKDIPTHFFRYLHLLYEYLYADLFEEKNLAIMLASSQDDEKKLYFGTCMQWKNHLDRESITTTWELVFAGLQFAESRGEIKEKCSQAVAGKIFVASRLKLQYLGKPDHTMYDRKVPSVACGLAMKRKGSFLLDEVVKNTRVRSEKMAEDSIRDFQDDMKKKYGIETEEPLISIITEEGGKTVVFNSDFWTFG